MRIKRLKTAIAAFFILLGGNLFGQQRPPIDLVLLLDTSSAMSGYYERINHYLTGSFLRDNLHLGDTFHLIAFSDTPRMEIARRVESRGDLETIIGRMLLMYPLEPQADIPAALSFVESYAENLNPGRMRKVVVLSPGGGAGSFPRLLEESRRRLADRPVSIEHVNPANLPLPPAATPAPGPAPPIQTAAPPVQPPASRPETPPVSTPAPGPAPPVQTAAPRPETPPVSTSAPRPAPPVQTAASRPETPPAATPAPRPAPPVQTTAPRPETPPVSTPAPGPAPPVQTTAPRPETSPLKPAPAPPEPVSPEPEPVPAAKSEPSQSAVPPAAPPAQTPVLRPRPARPVFADRAGALIARYAPQTAGFFALTFLGLLVFFLVRRLHQSPDRAVARAARGRDGSRPLKTPRAANSPGRLPGAGSVESPSPVKEPPPCVSRIPETGQRIRAGEPYAREKAPYTDKPAPKPEYGSPFMLKLFVADQNTLIGKRNTHLVKPGFSYTVGGGKSDFLIFLVSVPANIGELKYEASGCTFYPRKPGYFPDIGNNPVHDCIGKTIRVIADKGYELFIRLEQYEDPLLELNRLMLSINVPNPTSATGF